MDYGYGYSLGARPQLQTPSFTQHMLILYFFQTDMGTVSKVSSYSSYFTTWQYYKDSFIAHDPLYYSTFTQ